MSPLLRLYVYRFKFSFNRFFHFYSVSNFYLGLVIVLYNRG